MPLSGLAELAAHGSVLLERAASHSELTPGSLKPAQLVLAQPDSAEPIEWLGWCLGGDGPAWDGADLSPCVRLGLLNGLIPTVFVASSVLVGLCFLGFHIWSNRGGAIKLTTSSDTAECELGDIITSAENELVYAVAKEQADSGNAITQGGSHPGSRQLTWMDLLEAVVHAKKDLLNVAGSAALVVLVVLSYNASAYKSEWVSMLITAWAWALALALVKLGLGVHAHLGHLATGRGLRQSSWYAHIEFHLVPWLITYASIAFFNLRTALLGHYTDRPSAGSLPLEIATYAVALVLAGVELLAPRHSSEYISHSATHPLPLHRRSSLLSQWLFLFMDPFLYRTTFPRPGQERPTQGNVPDLLGSFHSAAVLESYRRNGWRFKKEASMVWRLAFEFKSELAQQQFWAIGRVLTVALPSLLLKGILSHIGKRYAGEESPLHVAFLFAWLSAILQIVASVTESQGRILGMDIAVKMKAIITGELLMKALRRKDVSGTHTTAEKPAEEADSPPAGGDKAEEEDVEGATGGKIMQLLANDVHNMAEACAYIHLVWPEMILTIGAAIGLLFWVLGWSAIAGLLVLVGMAPLSAMISARFFGAHAKLQGAADKRLELVSEIIRNMRLVKLFAWEKPFDELVASARENELGLLWQRAWTVIEQSVTTFGSPVIVSVATFVAHTALFKQPLPAETAFTALALFNILRGPLARFTNTLSFLLQARVGLLRVDAFLAEPDTDKFVILNQGQTQDSPTVGFYEAAFGFGKYDKLVKDDDAFKLAELSLKFPVGKLSLVTGPVGSGKSTLLLSLLGETTKLSGSAFLPSPASREAGNKPSRMTNSTAYCAQSAFLLSATIEKNITFGSAFEPDRFAAVLKACALDVDLKQWELGAQTEVGEKGTVLSGGQKARLALARAIYSSAKHVLLDDVLSAVDSHTAQHLLKNCLTGPLMKGRTCVLVTHAVDLTTSSAAYVVVLDQGRVVSAGPPSRLPKEALALLEAVEEKELAHGEVEEMEAENEQKKDLADKEHLKLVKEEEQKTGAVALKVYQLCFEAAGGWPMGIVLGAIFVVAQVSEIVLSLALREWAASYDDGGTKLTALQELVANVMRAKRSSTFWLGMYCLAAVFNLFMYCARVAYILRKGLNGSQIIFTRLMHALYTAPMRFWDSTPSGRIQTRLSKDTQMTDQEVAFSFLFLGIELIGVIGIILTISWVLPTFLIAAVFLGIIFYLIGILYVTPARDLKRFDSLSRAPIFSLFGECLQGVATIRAYSDTARFTRELLTLVDTNNRPFYVLQQMQQWLSVRINLLGALITFVATAFTLLSPGMDAGLAGFVLSFSMSFSERMMWVVALFGYLELELNSVERIQEYLELPQESQSGQTPPAIWPSRQSRISVENLTVSYAAGLPAVLKDVSFTIEPQEKIGVVGRTGSGKSSLALSFYRMMEPTSGRIVIDGININTLKLSELRSRLTIVAQEAALFAGTLRFNLDPFASHDDDELWDALRRVNLANSKSGLTTRSGTPAGSRSGSPSRRTKGRDASGISRLATLKVPERGATGEQEQLEEREEEEEEEKMTVTSLDMTLLAGGSNLSQGQRQLVALARGLLKLKTSPILLLDESTASLDHASDARIQRTIRDDMADATIICIAHRLRTIASFDKILVLGHGEVLEYGTPWDLLERGGPFKALCDRSGEFDDLVRLAEAARKKKEAATKPK